MQKDAYPHSLTAAQRGVGRGEAQLDLVFLRPATDVGALVGRQVVHDHVDRCAVGPGGADRLQRGQRVRGTFLAVVDAPQAVVADRVVAVEVAHPVGAVVGGRLPVRVFAFGPARACGRPDSERAELRRRRTPGPGNGAGPPRSGPASPRGRGRGRGWVILSRLLTPGTPGGTWTLMPATAENGQLALPADVMAVYDLGPLPYAEQLRWRAQRCPQHAAPPTAADLAVAEWEPFDPLRHHEYIHARLPAPGRRPGPANRARQGGRR